jgi:Cu(I)/Ag(I) efflux system membrane fusion protein
MAFDAKGAKWVQRDQPVANPYYGKAMLRCGEVRATVLPGERLAGPTEPVASPPAAAGTGAHDH